MSLRVLLLVLTGAMACTGAEEPLAASSSNVAHAAAPQPFEKELPEVLLVAEPAPEPPVEEETPAELAGIQLARMTVNEGVSLQPLSKTWQHEMHAIFQVAVNTKDKSESLLDALKELSPRVGRVKKYSDPRQRWTSTLPMRGIGAPSLWVECTSWVTINGRQWGRPKGCDGVWKIGAEAWGKVRDYAIKLVQMAHPPHSVQGRPVTWGGLMDIAKFIEQHPHMCWLESGHTRNYFFGLRKNPVNHCKPVPESLIQESKVLSAKLVERALKRRQEASREGG